MSKKLTNEERNLVSAAYKNVIGNKRAELRVLSAIEKKESSEAKQGIQQSTENNPKLKYISEYQGQIEVELKMKCKEILDLLDNVLIKEAESQESKVFYYKMKGDYNRYLCEYNLESEYKLA